MKLNVSKCKVLYIKGETKVTLNGSFLLTWKVIKRKGPWSHDPQGSHLDSKRQPPLRKGFESFLHHQKERCKRNSLATQEKSISELYRTNYLIRVNSLETKQTRSEKS